MLCLSLRVGNLLVFDAYSHQSFLFGTHIRIDSLMFGVLLSYLWHFHDLESRVRKFGIVGLSAGGLLLLSPAFFFPLEEHKWVSVFGVIPFYLGSGLLILAALRVRSTSNRFWALCGTLGASSYSIYLWHMPVEAWGWTIVRRAFGLDSFVWYFCFYLIGTMVVGWLMSLLVEWPVLKIRDRLFPNEPKPPKPDLAMQTAAKSSEPSI